ncbi:alpha/beta fold hydrolase [Myxococcus sp. AM009]|uniref:alpha/beta fold hydrolase n=1 Tax=unclassified Myxococcus TaxID=2648731 RepID=UPI0015958BEE|nr:MULTISPECIES: alpha/beta fold hydrolase [unclassified Myxococcus]NVJ02128.1 alpha/beta fold hydrolase [Myxococcus sp. AM009]NVJ18888.1 alpha/beta fold hydrolase [Myxococcus sp. AM010]
MDLMGGMQKALRHMLVARGVESTTVQVGSQTVHHYALEGQGKGPPVVLVHGLGGSANGFGRTLFGMAKRFSRVYAPDLPGHGFSVEYCGGEVCVRNQFEVLRTYVEEVVKAPAFVVGNSLGGAMAVNLAADHPQWVRALALVAPAGAQLPEAENTALLNSFVVKSPAEARAFTRRLFHRPPLPALLFAYELRHFYDTPTVRALTAEALATRACLEPEQVRNLAMPLLFLWGGSERLLPSETLNWYRAHLPAHAQVRVVEGFGHVPQLERPDELVSHLVRFADSAEL